jgi:hypothetical protein
MPIRKRETVAAPTSCKATGSPVCGAEAAVERRVLAVTLNGRSSNEFQAAH